MLDRLRHALLGAWARMICDHPKIVLLLTLGSAALCIFHTLNHLTFAPDRNDLISGKLDWNRRYIDYRHDFFGQDRIIVVAQPPPPEVKSQAQGSPLARKFVDELAARLESDKVHVQRVWSTIEGPPILMRLLPLPKFKAQLDTLSQAQPLLGAANVGALMANLTAALNQNDREGEAVDLDTVLGQIGQVRRLIDTIGGVMAGGDAAGAFSIETLFGESTRQYLSTPNNALYFLDIDAKVTPGEVDAFGPAVAAVRSAVVQVNRKYPTIKAGLTGLPVLEADETAVSLKDSTLSGIYSALAIAILLIVAYHGWQKPLLAIASLMIGVCWSFGFLTVSIGHLQVLSVVFTTILLGLGIDFGVHLMSRYELIRNRCGPGADGFSDAIVDTAQAVGPGMVTGAITSAVAFSTTLLTDFTGMAEMGFIAAVGVLLCLLAMWSVFPAALRLLRPHAHQVAHHDNRLINFHSQNYLNPIVRRPGVFLLIAAAIVGFASIGLWKVRFDNNLMNMLPTRLESVVWQQTIADNSDQAIWSAVTIARDLEEAERLTNQLKQLPGVASVGGAGMLFPDDERAKMQMIRNARRPLEVWIERAQSDTPGITPEQITAQLGGLGLALKLAQGRQEVKSESRLAGALGEVAFAIEKARSILTDPAQKAALADRAARLHQAFVAFRRQAGALLDDALSDRKLTLEDLPEYLRREAISKTQPVRYQLQAYPRDNIWDPAKLAPFLEGIRRIDPLVTGSPVQIHESGLLMESAYRKAGLLAVIAVLAIVFADLRKPLDTLLCMVPVAIGFITTFGIMWLSGVAVNPANLIVLPLMFGIGVASGVNIMHRYRMHPTDRPLGLAGGTGKSILLTSTTTILAFVAMLPAEHRGIRSLGLVLSVGLTMTLLASMTVMPAILELRNRWRGI